MSKMSEGLPVGGYKPQSEEAVAQVNRHKVHEEQILRILDTLQNSGVPGGGPVDQRWVQIARTHFEQGFMALNRSVFQPQRLSNEELKKLGANF